MPFEVILTDSFLKDVRKLKHKELEQQALEKLCSLEDYPGRNKRLRFELKEYYCLRVGKLRILYRVVGSQVIVEVLVLGHKYEGV